MIEQIESVYLSRFAVPLSFDESTVRKKLKEYVAEGLIVMEKQGRSLRYRRSADIFLPHIRDALDFFSEVAPCGVIGSYLLDRENREESVFGFKHHYITGTLDHNVLAVLFSAMGEKRAVTVRKLWHNDTSVVELVPLKIFISVQSGRQHLLAYDMRQHKIQSFRVDRLTEVTPGAVCPDFDALRERSERLQSHVWGWSAVKRATLGSGYPLRW